MVKYSRVKGSVSEWRRCWSIVARSYDWPFLVMTGSCMIANEMLSMR